jgi:hypothetical protein
MHTKRAELAPPQARVFEPVNVRGVFEPVIYITDIKSRDALLTGALGYVQWRRDGGSGRGNCPRAPEEGGAKRGWFQPRKGRQT